MENLKSYQSAYATLTADITASLSKIGQNLKVDNLPEDSIGNFNFENFSARHVLVLILPYFPYNWSCIPIISKLRGSLLSLVLCQKLPQ